MKLKRITNDAELDKALERISHLWGAETNTPDRDELYVLSLLVEKYEEENYSIPPSDPVEAIKFIMDQNGLSRDDLQTVIGSAGRVSEVLGRRQELSLSMIKRLHSGLKIPYESLIG